MYYLNSRPSIYTLSMTISLLALSLLLSACGVTAPAPSTPTPPSLADTLIFYNWEDDMPQSILDAFTEEHGVKVSHLTYEEQEEAIDNMKAGEIYDVVVLNNEFIPNLGKDGALAEINHQNVPNIKNLAASFRDLSYDPGNKHSIPYNWGTTGLIVRNDLVAEPITQWADLWDSRYAGQIGLYTTEQRTVIALALKAQGYSINSEDPNELNETLEHLIKLNPVIFTDEPSTAPLLINEHAVIALGFADDAATGQEAVEAIDYVLPEDGAILWGDNFVIPANSPNKYTAELFLDFLLRPEIAGQLTNETSYATPNEAAHPFIDEEILNDPTIFPPNEALVKAEILLPLSPEGETLYDDIWQQFVAAQ